MRLCLIITASLSLSLATPALADEGGGDGVDQPITTESSAPSAQALDRAYCDNIELGHPDLERCEGILEGLVAEEELALEELMYMEAQADEERLNQMVAESSLIAAERRDEAPERSVAVSRLTEVERGTRSNAGVLLTSAAVGGLGGVGLVGGLFVGFGACMAVIVIDEWDCFFGGGSAGAAVGALLGMYQGYRWARPNSSNGSSSRDVEQSDRQVIEFLPYPLAIAGGLAALIGSDDIGAPPYIGDGDSFYPLLTLGGVGMIGAAIYLARRNSRSKAGESPLPVSISPYRHDDASGLMFSGQF